MRGIDHEHDSGKGFTIRRNGVYRGSTGEDRHVINIHKPGNGYAVSWDSVPRSHPEFYDEANHEARPHGYMTMKAFKHWAVRDVTPESMK